MMLANLYIKRPEIDMLIKEMLSKFWDIDTVVDPKAKKRFLFRVKILKYKCLLYVRLILIEVVIYIYGEPVRRRELTPETYPVVIYYPAHIPVSILTLYVTISACLIMICDVINDTLMFTTVTLTSIQYQMLNIEMKNIFMRNDFTDHQEIFRKRIRRCNDHLGFLLK